MAFSYVRYTGNGSTTNYTFPFSYLSTDHVKVRIDGTLTALFSFLNPNTIQLFSAPASGAAIEIRRETPKEQPIVNFTDGSVLLERDLDLLATFDLYIAQEAEDLVGDVMNVDSTGRWDAEGRKIGSLAAATNPDEAVNKQQLDYEYPAVSAVAEFTNQVNIVASDLGIATGLSSDLGSVADGVITAPGSGTSKVVTVADNITDVTTVADNITAVQNITANLTAVQNAASNATSAASSASAASTSASSAASSASTASTAAATATTKASEASSSASSASSSASAAAGSASAAATSASDAAASAASAAAMLDNFDDRYLGPKASAPTLDNDGNALVIGALYFDTTTGKMRVNTASGWVDASAASQAALTVYKFTATAGQTAFSGTSASGTTLAYLVGGIVVTLNGSVLVGGGDDYTASNGTSVVLTSGASVGDVLEVYAFSSFSIASLNGSAIVDGTVTVDELAPILDLGVLT